MRVVKQLKDYVFSPEDRYFLFTDGSLREQQRSNPLMGLGADLRDKEGKKILFYSENIRVSELPSFANKDSFEAMALLNALTICRDRGIKNLVIQNDSSGLMVNVTKYLDTKELGQKETCDQLLSGEHINTQIFSVLNSFDQVFAQHIYREENKEADFYSRTANSLKQKDFLDKHLSGQLSNSDSIVQEVKDYYAQKALKNRPHTMMFLPAKGKGEIVRLKNNKEQSRYEVEFERKIKHTIHAPYTEKNKQLVLLFLTLNLVTEKSSISFINKSHLDFFYKDDVWLSFSNVEAKQLKEKEFHMNQALRDEIRANQSFDFSQVINASKLAHLTKAAFNPKATYTVREKLDSPKLKP